MSWQIPGEKFSLSIIALIYLSHGVPGTDVQGTKPIVLHTLPFEESGHVSAAQNYGQLTCRSLCDIDIQPESVKKIKKSNPLLSDFKTPSFEVEMLQITIVIMVLIISISPI